MQIPGTPLPSLSVRHPHCERARPASPVVAGLSLASILLVILPLLVFLIWIAALGVIDSVQPGRPAVHAREVS